MRKVGSMVGRLVAMKALQMVERMAEKWVESLGTQRAEMKGRLRVGK